MHPKVHEYLTNAKQWQEELTKLREVLLDCQLTEEFKWRAPCYTCEGGNIVILAALKECCTLGFFKGALLKDPKGILAKPGDNTRAARVIRFVSVAEIDKLQATLKAYVREAIAVEKKGLKVDFEQDREIETPAELQNELDEDPALRTAFEALTPGRQRGYLMFFSAAKQAKTRAARVEKYRQQILDGKGIHDCTCRLSQKLPACDGSHKHAR